MLVSCVIWNTSGFHFRPLLFLVFIADLGVDLNQDLALILKYVDDTICIQGIQNEEDVELLQTALDNPVPMENNQQYAV